MARLDSVPVSCEGDFKVKRYILKEYGSWGAMIMAYLAGILTSGGFKIKAALLLLAMSLFINSKQAFTLWMRHVDSVRSLKIFIVQIVIASLIMLGILGESVAKLLPCALIPAAYILLLYLAGEHAIVTEICGFTVLTLSSLIAKFVISGVVDFRLYIAVAAFFTAGVFKVRLQLKRNMSSRIAMALYVVSAVSVYLFIQIPVVLLLPLADNLLHLTTMYKVKLRTTGWIEVAKGLMFLALLAFYW